MAKRIRARGMNAALASGEAGVGEMTPARSPLRPKQFGVALAAAVVGSGLGMFTYHAVSATTTAYSGLVSPSQTYYLNFAADGSVLALDVKPGEHVKKGQALATQDSSVAQSQLSAAQAAATADAAVVAEDENPQATASSAAADALSVSQAQAAVSAAQNALTVQQSAAQHTVSAQSSAVTSAESTFQSDSNLYAADCSSTTTPPPTTAPPAAATTAAGPTKNSPSTKATTPTATSTPTSSSAEVQHEQFCANLETTINRDSTSVSSAQAELANVQSSVQLDEQRDSSNLTSSQNVLTAAETRQQAATAPVTPAILDQAKAQLATAQAQVATDQQALQNTKILAPADGVVAETAGAAGEVVGPTGVHGYQGPGQQSGTQSNSGSGFELFVPQTSGSNNSTSNQNAYMPLITLYTSPLTVVAQIPESNMASVHEGVAASISITALNLTVSGKVDHTELAAVESSSTTYYDVTISLDSNDSRLMAGMSAQVTIG